MAAQQYEEERIRERLTHTDSLKVSVHMYLERLAGGIVKRKTVTPFLMYRI